MKTTAVPTLPVKEKKVTSGPVKLVEVRASWPDIHVKLNKKKKVTISNKNKIKQEQLINK
jgi:hypothetical protein